MCTYTNIFCRAFFNFILKVSNFPSYFTRDILSGTNTILVVIFLLDVLFYFFFIIISFSSKNNLIYYRIYITYIQLSQYYQVNGFFFIFQFVTIKNIPIFNDNKTGTAQTDCHESCSADYGLIYYQCNSNSTTSQYNNIYKYLFQKKTYINIIIVIK